MNSAAGNDGTDACVESPSGATGTLAVAASTPSDYFPTWSNYGVCARLTAPGQGVNGAWIGSTTATRAVSGTSVSSPFVAGTSALFMSSKVYTAPYQVYWDLRKWATRGAITNYPYYTPNALLYQLDGASPP